MFYYYNFPTLDTVSTESFPIFFVFLERKYLDISRENELGDRNKGSARRREGKGEGYWGHWSGMQKEFNRVQPKDLADGLGGYWVKDIVA